MTKESIRAALKSPLSLLVLLYGAFALFSLVRRWYDIPLAPVVVNANAIYRATVSGFLNSTIGHAGFALSHGQQDMFVLWIAVGRVVSRSYLLLTRETVRRADVEYNWFYRLPFLPLTCLSQWFGSWSRGKAYWLGLGISSLVITITWPLFIWTFLADPTVHKRSRWRVNTGGTPHPSDRTQIELPPVGDELSPKFSKEESSVRPLYNAIIVMLTYLVAQLIAVCLLATANFALGAWPL